ncbi:MAG: sigma 54-interacting transcriptional regulator [Desulfovibrio sp.]|jgi:PAS domain S-box-containing protein|nr:sigma 54-interacting transcriptional regulator [Desulfovibrio sp.]
MSASSVPELQSSPVIDSILEAVPAPIVCIDTQGTVRLCNNAMLDLMRLKREEVVGRHIDECAPDNQLTSVLETREAQTWRRFCFGDRPFLISRLPLYIDGQPAGALAGLHEISELERISSELKTFRIMKEELEGIFQAAMDGICVADGQSVILRVNASCLRITGLKKEEFLGFSTRDLVKSGFLQQSAILKVLESGAPCSMLQTARNGAPILISANPLRDAAGKIVRVVAVVRDLTELNRLRDELRQADHLKNQYEKELEQLRRHNFGATEIIAKSASMHAVLDLATRVSSVDSTVLILGESGSGKERIADFIHKHSQRCAKPFIKINCAAIPEPLLESELFGYVRGAFTGANREGKVGLIEAAHGGTLLLDEIGDLPPGLQVKLLRVLQEKQTQRIGSTTPCAVDVRIIAATNRDLTERVDRKLFREDLYYRLNVVPIYVPPLRRRREDILPMVYAFLGRHCEHHQRRRELHPSVLPLLLDYHWPGNVRELENLMERLVVTAPGDIVTVRDLPRALRRQSLVLPESMPAGTQTLKEALERVEAAILKDALAKCRSTRCAAKALGINQSTVVRKAKAYGLTVRGDAGGYRPGSPQHGSGRFVPGEVGAQA